jgi:hypothetical protein
MNDPLTRIDFALVGTPKAGTTTLEYILKRHPAVAILPGRTRIFGPQCDRDGLHRAHAALEVETQRCIGHFRADTVIDDEALAAMHALGIRRVIYCVRHPVARTYSHYWHGRRKGRASMAFRAWLETPSGREALALSSYGAGLRRIRRYFDPADVHVIHVHETTDPQALAALLRFLALDEAPLATMLQGAGARNEARLPRSVPLVAAFDRMVRVLPIPRRWRRRLFDLRDRWFMIDARPPAIGAEDAAFVWVSLRDDVADFERLTGRSTGWASPRSER